MNKPSLCVVTAALVGAASVLGCVGDDSNATPNAADSGPASGDASASSDATIAADGGIDTGAEATADAGCRALHFGVKTDTVVAQHAAALDFGSVGTLETWLFEDDAPDGGSAGGTIFNKWVNFQEDKFLAVNSVGGVFVYVHTGGTPVSLTSSNAVTPGHWTHIAVAFDKTSTRIYVDGTKVGEQAGPLVAANSNGAVQIGHVARDSEPLAILGFLSEVRLSTIARYTDTFTPAAHLTADSDTAALWKLDEGTGTAAADSSGHGVDAVITGPAWLAAPCR